jgi:hypothetical protein
LSHVEDINKALFYHTRNGPTFGSDLYLYANYVDYDDSKEYNRYLCKKHRYGKEIRNTSDYFSIEDYEVFQIIKNEAI